MSQVNALRQVEAITPVVVGHRPSPSLGRFSLDFCSTDGVVNLG